MDNIVDQLFAQMDHDTRLESTRENKMTRNEFYVPLDVNLANISKNMRDKMFNRIHHQLNYLIYDTIMDNYGLINNSIPIIFGQLFDKINHDIRLEST